MRVETTKEQILEAANKCPQAKEVLRTLFPEVFISEKRFCRIGQLFFRKSYPKNVYAVIKQNSEIKVMNITHSTLWNTGKLMVYDLKDHNKENITIGEFLSISKYSSISDMQVLDEDAINFLKLRAK